MRERIVIKDSNGKAVNYSTIQKSKLSELNDFDLEQASEYLTSDIGIKEHVVVPLSIFVSMEIQKRNHKKGMKRSLFISSGAMVISIFTLLANIWFNIQSDKSLKKSLDLTSQAVQLNRMDADNDGKWRIEQVELLRSIMQNTQKSQKKKN